MRGSSVERTRTLVLAVAPAAEVVLEPVAAVKLVDRYAYRSCEHRGWDVSAAALYCRRPRGVE